MIVLVLYYKLFKCSSKIYDAVVLVLFYLHYTINTDNNQIQLTCCNGPEFIGET